MSTKARSSLDLEDAIRDMKKRLDAKKTELRAVEAEYSGLIDKLLDAQESERGALIARRGELYELRSVLTDEIQALDNRIDAAKLAICELAEAKAKAEVDRLGQLATDKRRDMNQVANKHLSYINRHSRTVQTDEAAKELADMESKKVLAATESRIADLHARKAKEIHEAALAELDELRQTIDAKHGPARPTRAIGRI